MSTVMQFDIQLVEGEPEQTDVAEDQAMFCVAAIHLERVVRTVVEDQPTYTRQDMLTSLLFGATSKAEADKHMEEWIKTEYPDTQRARVMYRWFKVTGYEVERSEAQ